MKKRPLMGPVLVAVDFSEASLEALGLGIVLASHFRRKLVVVHVIHWFKDNPGSFRNVANEGLILDDLKRAFNDVRRGPIVKGLSGVQPDPTYCVRRGVPVKEILVAIQETNARLVVMGTHGRKGLTRALMGSVAEGVSRRAPCPVLTCRQRRTASNPVKK